MTKLWYNNIKVLIEDPFQFIPSDNLTEYQKINSLARLGLYLIIAINVFGLNQSFTALPILLIVTSFFLGRTENFVSESKKKPICYKPTEANPFMNYTLGDQYNDPERPANCPINLVRGEMRKQFLKRIVPDPMDLWGQNYSDRNFYTMPSTTAVNQQKKFADWCYGTTGQCKAFGKNCLKRALTRTGTGMFGSAL